CFPLFSSQLSQTMVTSLISTHSRVQRKPCGTTVDSRFSGSTSFKLKWDSDSHSRVMTTPKPTIKPNEYKFYECSHKPTHHLINNIEKFHSTWPNIRTH
ncbi:unnamed protein product, partial [Brassica oleracea var. botrytis]